MGSLRENILRYELQKEINKAKKLSSLGKGEKAAFHYSRAASIYKILANISPKEKAKKMFDTASQYEKLARGIKTRESVKELKELPEITQEEIISSSIVSEKPEITWNDIGNLSEVKREIKEAIILPFIKKPKFVEAPRTILLYGPPGTGKTLLAKASSNVLNATFFEARGSSLLSKYFGESTKLVNALFNKARKEQPSIIFMDELDSLAPSREANINESSRRVLGQLLIEIEGFSTRKEDKILIMGATNKPWDLDDALVSRFQKRIYIPLPDFESRKDIFKIHLRGAELNGISLEELAKKSEGFSGRDIANVCREAIMNMVRKENPELESLDFEKIKNYSLKYRALTKNDFDLAFEKIKPSVETQSIEKYEEWKKEFGV